ncbi:DNA translocase FtsK 4TM domain-containing protein [Hydrogenimonas sp. SS33]|uniref:FtsK/SpoIIIE family DNA translocase n=1 Tax=Hydrogenimonas leucolamina TaxID=2954236 RepID=UPI00336BC9F9
MVGSFGTYLGSHNVELFGYLAYADFLFLLYPLYRLYKMRSLRDFHIDTFAAWLLFLFSLLILQALVVSPPMRGWIGASIVDFLHPYIGNAGVWLFWLMTLTLSGLILWGEKMHWHFSTLGSRFPAKKRHPEPRGQEAFDREEAFAAPVETKTEFEEEETPLEPEPAETAETEAETPPFDIEDQEEKEPQIKLIKRPKTPSKKEEAPEPAHAEVEIVHEIEENKALLKQIELGEQAKPKNFVLPKLDFLQKPPKRSREINEAEIDAKIKDLLDKLAKFKIEGDVVRTYAGPVVTTFEFKPAAHIKVSKILNLQDDLAMALRAQTIRIQAPVPGKDVVGIEIPNKQIETIYLREILENDIFKKSKSPLTIALGKDIVGKPFVTDLAKLPHLLIAGTTGSGKSVGINAMILSLLYRNSPDQLKLMMIDPKMLEFSIYNDIPHLLTPVITQPKKAIVALSNMVGEMERRYQLMSQTKTKNIETYNAKARKEKREELPYIVVVIDELADLMMTGGKDVEFSIARLAQMARASGIHLIVATQRPSVDVVTGLIKANLPSRISYKVGQKIDSKVILDALGAESLLGRGDMLFTPPGGGGLIRLHAPWSSEQEIETIVEFLKSQREAEYDEHFLMEEEGDSAAGGSGTVDDIDPLFEEAKQIVLSDRKSSISYIQRRLQIGYNRAARIVEQLEKMGVLSAPNAKGNREILQ